jgi:Zn-finger nucleic acid-binding protein
MSFALTCPRCAVALAPQLLDTKTVWSCSSCAGHAINLAALRRDVESHIVNALWQLARKSEATSLPCPSCQRALRLIHYAENTVAIEADLCTSCQLIWLDHGELDGIRRRYAPPAPARTSVPRASAPNFSEIRQTDDLSGIGTAADLMDLVLNIVWSTFR